MTEHTSLAELITRVHELKVEAHAIEADTDLPLMEKRDLRANNETQAMDVMMGIAGVLIMDIHDIAASLRSIAKTQHEGLYGIPFEGS